MVTSLCKNTAVVKFSRPDSSFYVKLLTDRQINEKWRIKHTPLAEVITSLALAAIVQALVCTVSWINQYGIFQLNSD